MTELLRAKNIRLEGENQGLRVAVNEKETEIRIIKRERDEYML